MKWCSRFGQSQRLKVGEANVAWEKPDKAAEWRAKMPTEQEAVAND